MPPKRGHTRVCISAKPVMEMNRSYDEIEDDDVCDIENQKKVSQTCEERCETFNTWFQGYLNSFVWFIKWIMIYMFFMFIIFLLGSYIIELIKCRQEGHFCEYNGNYDHLLKENYNQSTHRVLTVAGVIHNKRMKHSCDDYAFGCCKIYTDCNMNDTSIVDYKTLTMDYVPKINKEGTNCPRLSDLVTLHNHHYPLNGGFNCEMSESGCYKIETGCDIRIRFMDIEDGLEDDVDLYKKNVNGGYKYTHLVERVDIDLKPSITSLMYEYQNKYPSMDFEGIAFVCFGLPSLVGLCVMCSECKQRCSK